MTAKKGSTKKGAKAEHRPDLCVLLAGVLAHPDLPYELWGAIIDGILAIDIRLDKYENPEVIREALGLNKQRRAAR